MTRHGLAIAAVRAAARVRAELGIGPAQAVCPYDVAEQLDVPVRLVALPSLEGMYSPEPTPTIVVSAERPAGRRRFTCGHELGHHVFKHGARLDELKDREAVVASPEEYTAQRFAAALLMPNLAIDSAFSRRGHSAASAPAPTVFAVAQELGVGFLTLVGHLERTIERISTQRASDLRRIRLPTLRAQMAGLPVEHDLTPVDEHWHRPTVDIEVGDVIVVSSGSSFRGECVAPRAGSLQHLIAQTAGIGILLRGNNPAPLTVRVSRQGFTGLARYRNLEESGDE